MDLIIAPIYAKLIEQYQGEELLDKLNQLRRDALDQLIESKLVLQQARKMNINVDDADVEEKLQEVRSRFSSPDEFENALKQQGLTIEDLKNRYREQIMSGILMARSVHAKIFVSPSEVAAYYNGHKDKFRMPQSVEIWNILVRVDDDNNDKEAKKKAIRIWKMVKAGAEFSSMAKKYSEGPFAEKGGYMGFVKKNQLKPELDKVIFRLNKGEVSKIVKSNLGYHIFQAGKKTEPRILRMDEVKDQIKNAIYAKKSEIEYLKWMNELKEDAYIDIKEN
jgi:peptidyl-prolyl cis-trans isomerase SurA